MKELVEDLKIANDNLYSANKMLEKEIERLNKELEKYKYSADELNEIERLNNIIKELEKDLEKERKIDRPRDDYNYGLTNALDYVLYKLQELKENKC